MPHNQPITIEGYTADELLGLPDEQIDELVFSKGPIAFRIGSAEILGHFKIDRETLIAELAHIDGGGEGVLPALWLLVERYARRKRVTRVMWVVHAVHCASPNPKLRRVLEARDFTVQDIDGRGDAYTLIKQIQSAE